MNTDQDISVVRVETPSLIKALTTICIPPVARLRQSGDARGKERAGARRVAAMVILSKRGGLNVEDGHGDAIHAAPPVIHDLEFRVGELVVQIID